MVSRLSRTQERYFWLSAGALLIVITLFALSWFLGGIVLGVFGYYATRPFYRRARRYSRWDTVAASAALVAFFGPVVLLLLYMALIGLRELQAVARTFEDPLVETLFATVVTQQFDVQSTQAALRRLQAGDISFLVDTLTTVARSVNVLSAVLITLFLGVVTMFYLLRDGHHLSRWFTSLFPGDTMARFASAVDRDFRYIFFGNMLNAAIAGGLAIGVYTLLNLASTPPYFIQYPFLLGVLTGLASLIPVVGMKVVYGPIAVYFYVLNVLPGAPRNLWFPTVFLAVTAVVVDGLPDLFLRPYLSGRHVHMGLLLVAYVMGPVLFGWYGLFLGPMLLVLMVHFARIVLPELVGDAAGRTGLR